MYFLDTILCLQCVIAGGAATMSIAQKMVNKEWVTLDDIASCGEVRG